MSVSLGGDGRAGPREFYAPRFIGRERELAAVQRALSHPPAVVLVEGDAGIGKSRLVRELLAAPGQPWHDRTLVGACPPFREPFTLGPVVSALRQAADRVDDLPLTALAGALRPLFPEWAPGLPPAPEPLHDASAARHRLFRALAELLGCLDVQLLVVEDAHWSDEATLEFLLFLATRQPQGLSLLTTCRPDDLSADSLLPRLFARVPTGTTRLRVPLPPLAEAETARLVSSMLDGKPVSAEFATFLHVHTDGLPLAIEESVRLLHDRADLIREDGGWVRRDIADIVVPASVRDAVQERAARLGTEAMAVLRSAAVLAEPADEAVLVAVSALPADRAGAGVAEALGSGLLEDDAHGHLSYRHALACRAVYEAIPAGERREYHLRAGQALQRAARPPVVQLARHFREARQTSLWYRYAEQAADLALVSGDPQTAFKLLHDVLTRAEPSATALTRLMYRIPTNVVTDNTQIEGLLRTLRARLADDALTAAERAGIRLQMGRMMFKVGGFEAGWSEIETAIPDLADRPLDAAHAMVMLGWPHDTSRTVAAHRRWLERAAVIEKDPSTPAVHRSALIADRATGLLMLGEEAGWAAAAELPTDGGTPEEVEQIARGQANLAQVAAVWGQYGDARRWPALAGGLAHTHQYDRLRDRILTTTTRLDWWTGAWSGLAEQVAALAEPDREPAARLEALLIAGLLDAASGEPADAESKMRAALEMGRRRGVVDGSLEPAAALAGLHMKRHQVDEALGLTEEPMRVIACKRIWLWATDVAPVRTRALVVAGRRDEAARLVTAFGRGLTAPKPPSAGAALVMCRAVLAEAQGQPGRAAVQYARAADAWQALPRPYDALLARERQAACLLAAGQEEAGLALLSRVFQDLSGLGARADAEQVRQTLSGLGVRVPRAGRVGRPSYGDRLSPRELEVVRLLATGQTNQEIARALSLSPKTVASHIDSALRKHNVVSRTALAMRAVEAGLVPIERPHGPAK
jgi:DNA-binding CsgD family transcriptional regulator